MNAEELKNRSKKFSLRIFKLVAALPNSVQGRAIGSQLIRCGTSVAANYRAACRARSKAEFVVKIGLVEEEADESAFWLELLIEANLIKSDLLAPLLQETRELVAIIAASKITASGRVHRSQIANRKSQIS